MTDRASARGLIHAAVERHRRELLRMERGAASEMVRAYGAIWQRLRVEIMDLSRQYNEALAANEAITPAWVFEFGRLDTLQRQTEAELGRFIAQAEASIIAQEREAVEAAQQHFGELLQRVSRPGLSVQWARLPVGATEDLVGYLRNGSPLRVLLDELGPQASQSVREGLLTGLALGQNPRDTARRVRAAFGGSLDRALKISRTETMRAYRSATLRTYRENSDIVTGWRWLAAKSPRTCPMCLAMDGTWHPLTEELNDHPNGRCAAVPALRGDPRDDPGWETGRQWLEKQPEDVQCQVLGDAGYEAYRAGAVSLDDFVGVRRSREWGTTRRARSLVQILGEEGQQRWISVARAVDAGESQHPADRMVRRLIALRTQPRTEEMTAIAARLQEAPFASRQVRVDRGLVGQTYLGREISAREDSLFAHLVTRVLKDQQFREGTTAEEYVGAIQAVLSAPSTEWYAYQFRGTPTLLAAGNTDVLPSEILGPKALPRFIVVFGADYGTIRSGYQASSLATVTIPEEALRWK